MSVRPAIAMFAVLAVLVACAWGAVPTLRDDALGGFVAGGLARNAVPLAVLDDPASSGVAVYLVAGSDRRDAAAGPGPDVWGERADAVMLWAVPASGAVTVLSLPRDVRVHLPRYGDNKLGGALDRGPGELITAVRTLTGLPVHHYVKVEFAGLTAVVDGLGGVPVTVAAPAQDPSTGLELRGGEQVLDGAAALAFVRSRHYEELLDGRWTPVPGDLGRIERQHQLLRGLLARLPERCPSVECLEVLSALGRSVTVDRRLGGDDVRQLMAALWRPRAQVSTATLPTRLERAADDSVSPFPPFHDGGSGYRVLDQPAAGQVLDRLRHEVGVASGYD
jgi:LCP family protein required for cell wall assembly